MKMCEDIQSEPVVMRIFLYDNFMTNGFYYIGRRAGKNPHAQTQEMCEKVWAWLLTYMSTSELNSLKELCNFPCFSSIAADFVWGDTVKWDIFKNNAESL